MAGSVLRHGAAPAIDAGETWLGRKRKNLSEVAAHHVDQVVVGQFQHGLVASTPDEAAQDALVVGRAMRELDVDESASEHAAVLTARYQKAEAGRELVQVGTAVAQVDGDRRAVTHLSEFRGKDRGYIPKDS